MELITVFISCLIVYITQFYTFYTSANTAVKFLYANNVIEVIFGMLVFILCNIKCKNLKEAILFGTVSLIIAGVLIVIFILIHSELLKLPTDLNAYFVEIMILSFVIIGVNLANAIKNFRQLKRYKKLTPED